MKPIHSEDKNRLAQVVESRAGIGQSEIVTGWQDLLIDLLARMSPFLKAGAMITFQQLLPGEKRFFEALNASLEIPPTNAAVFLPPSVRHQMLGGDPAGFDSAAAPDSGVLIASGYDSHEIIVNALFASPPFTPAVDVYDQGTLVAGYQYDSIAACQNELTTIIRRHLNDHQPPSI
jgi:hypothetical protein